MSKPADWIDWPRAEADAINQAMRDASEAFNRAYFESPAAADLARNVGQTIDALTRVRAALAAAAPSEPQETTP